MIILEMIKLLRWINPNESKFQNNIKLIDFIIILKLWISINYKL